MSIAFQLKLTKDEAHALKNAIAYYLGEKPQQETNQRECMMLSDIHGLLVKHGA